MTALENCTVKKHEDRRTQLKILLVTHELAYKTETAPLRKELYAISRRLSALKAKERKKTP